MKRRMLSKTARPSSMAATMVLKLSSVRISEIFLANPVDPVNPLSQLVARLQDAVYAINNVVDPDAFKNRNMARTLTNKLSAVLEMIEQGLYAERRWINSRTTYSARPMAVPRREPLTTTTG